MRSSRYFLLLLSLICAKAYLYRSVAYGDRNPLHTLLLELPVLVLVMGVVGLLPKRAGRWPLALTHAALSLLLLGSAGYVSYFGTLVTPQILTFTNQLGALQETVADLWSPVYLLFLADIPVVMYFAVAGSPLKSTTPAVIGSPGMSSASLDRLRRRQGSRANVERARLFAATLAAALIVAGQVAFAMRLPAAADATLIARARGTAIAQLALILRPAPDPVGEAAAASRDGLTQDPPANETPPDRVARLIREARGPVTGERLVGFDRGAYKGAPIIFVQVEALQTMDMGTKIDGHAVAPNFSAFANESYYFPNMVPQLSRGNTSDVEWTANSGLNPPVASAACLEYVGKKVPGLPRLLGEQQAYTTFTGHANEAAFWNRSRLYPALGFGRYYDKEYFGRADAMWSGVSDEVFFEKSLALIKDAAAKKKPYYANLITLSSHQPYVYVPKARRPLKLTPAQSETVVGRHLGAISYTDKAFGEFLSDLEDAGILDRAIVVVIGDHWAIQGQNINDDTSRALIRQLLGRDYTAVDKLKVPLMIHLPGQSAGVRSEATVGDVDIAPTLADAVGLDLSHVPMIGRSAFERHKRLVQTRTGAPGGSFANSRVIYLAGLTFKDGTALSLKNGLPTILTRAEETDFEHSAALNTLCDEWIRLLPDRSTAGDAKSEAVIPNRK